MVKDKSTLVSTSGCPARIEVNLITKLSHSSHCSAARWAQHNRIVFAILSDSLKAETNDRLSRIS